MTETEIANIALAMIGGKSLAALATDTTAQAVSCRKFFDLARDEALSAQNWNFAAKRDRLTTTYASLSGGSAIADNGSGLIRVTHTSHGLVTGYRAYIKEVEGVTGANGYWYVTRINDNAFDLVDSVFSGTYTASTGSFVRVPLFAWDFWHTLPSDCIKVRRMNDGVDSNGEISESEEKTTEPFKVEVGKILCNLETAFINYTYRNETTTEWPAEFITAFSTLLASYLAQDLTGPGGKSADLRATYEKLMLPAARGRDAREGKGTAPATFLLESKFLASRQ